MALGLEKLAKTSIFDEIGRVPVKSVTKKDFKLSFLDFEESKLQPLINMQPAAVLRPDGQVKGMSWHHFQDWSVTPKSQHLVLNSGGHGYLGEADEGDGVKLEQFFATNARVDDIKDEEMFETKNVAGVAYVNDIPITKDMVSDGDIWSMFNNLGLEKLGDVSGVSSPWGYAGTRGSTFPVHMEDSNLGSVNYLLDGKPKIWFVVHPADRDKFVFGLKKLYPKEYKKCSQYHRHKNLFVNPVKVQKELDIAVFRIEQLPGDLVVTWPGTFHWGYNSGLNASMAVNYCPKGDLASSVIKTAKQCSPSCKVGPTIFLPTEQLFASMPKAFSCKKSQCPSNSFTSPQGLVEHLWVAHKEKVKVGNIGAVNCPVCGKNVKKLADHMMTHKIVGGTCNLCGVEVEDKKTHWVQGCKDCKFCKKNGKKRLFYDMKMAWQHYEH